MVVENIVGYLYGVNMTKEEIFLLAEKADLYLASDDSIINFAKLIAEKSKQEQGEPVAYVNDQYSRDGYNDEISKLLPVGTYLYTAPQQRKPLTFEQVEDCFGDGATAEENGILVSAQWLHDFARAIESAHGIKE